MFTRILFVVSAVALVGAQVPNLGWCPDYAPMSDFDMTKFMGVWYETARYFQILEVGSRCVMSNYTKGPDGKMEVSNEVTWRLTGSKRVFKGEIKPSPSKDKDGMINVKYAIPLLPDIKLTVLDTDYKNYAVLWSCNGIGPINGQNAWLMTRSRKPTEEVMQMAYGVLDKYAISRTFFIKSDQEDCALLDATPAAEKPVESENVPSAEVPSDEAAPEEVPQELRSAIAPSSSAIGVETRKSEQAQSADKPTPELPIATASLIHTETLSVEIPRIETKPEILDAMLVRTESADKPAADVPIASTFLVQTENLSAEIPRIKTKTEILNVQPVEAIAIPEVVSSPISVPEVILKTADRVKETAAGSSEDVKQFQPLEALQEAFANPAAQIQEAFSKPVAQIQQALSGPVNQIQQAFSRPVTQLQEAFAAPIAQIQETFSRPFQNIQQAFNRPVETVPEPSTKPENDVPVPIKKPVEPVKKPATEAMKKPVKEPTKITPVEIFVEELPEKILEKETTPEKIEKKEEEMKIVS